MLSVEVTRNNKLVTNSMEQSPGEADSHSATQFNSLPFIESEGTLPCSQEPYPEPDESTPHLPTLFPSDPIEIHVPI
jgi:hypothetical protein